MKPILYIVPLECRNYDSLPVLSTLDSIASGKYPNYNVSLQKLIDDKNFLFEYRLIIIFNMPMNSINLIDRNFPDKHLVQNWYRLFNLCLDICKQRKDTRLVTGCDWDENNVYDYNGNSLIKTILSLLVNKSVRYSQVTWLYNNPFVPLWLDKACIGKNESIHCLYHSSYIKRMKNVKKEIYENDLVISNNKSHYFLSLNRFSRPHRMMLSYWMYKNCKKPAYISCRLAEEENYNSFWHSQDAYNHLNEVFYNGLLDEKETYLSFASTLPWQLDHKTDDKKTLSSLQQDKLPSSYIFDSACYIVTETHLSLPSSVNHQGFISEKTFKGFIWGLPAIYIAPAYTIQALKLLGYKSYNSLINEAYDNEFDSIKRIKMVFDEIDRIQSIENISDWYMQGSEIYRYNYDKLHEYINRDVSQLIEDYHTSYCHTVENMLSSI